MVSFQSIPRGESDIRRISRAARLAMDGKTNNTGTVTLTASSATTTLTDARIGPSSVILFMATTANAAAALGGLYASARGDGTATLTHANDANADKTFAYAIVG